MRVLLTGTSGQLGQALKATCPKTIDLIATCRSGGEGVLALDLGDAQACRRMVLELRPDWVLNAGAYTAVDKAESEATQAMAVNGGAPQAFAEAQQQMGGRLLQVSTDFVFNGQQGSPYRPEQTRDPLGTYGATKAMGEQAVEQIMGGSDRYAILRTSWVIGPVGTNFALTMLRLHGERGSRGEELRVVADQVGCPTSTFTLAEACWRTILAKSAHVPLPPVLHWSDAGAASWYDVAMAVGEIATEIGLLKRPAVVNPISTSEYPLPAKRPSFSLLDCTETRELLKYPPTHWRQTLRKLLGAVK